MADYTITFMPLRAAAGDSPYVLNIGSGSGGTVLKGAAQPFVTEEDDTDDPFTPIRTQSGYIRILDDGTFNWRSLIPATDTSTPVTLTRGGTVVWQGFMQAQNFSGDLYGNPQVREFPVQCMLQALSNTDFDISNKTMQNVAWVIKTALTPVLGQDKLAVDNYIFEGGSQALDFLNLKVDPQNYVEEDDEGNLVAKWDNSTVLEDICRFFGWTLRTCGKDVYFTRNDSLNATKLTMTQANLDKLATPGQTAVTYTTNNDHTVTIGNIFASTNNEETFARGYNKALVTAKSDGQDEVMSFAPKSVEKAMIAQGYTTQAGGAPITNDLLTFPTNDVKSNFLAGSAVSGKGAFVMQRESDSTSVHDIIFCKKTIDSMQNPTIQASLQTVYEHSFYCDDDFSYLTDRGAGLRIKGKFYFLDTGKEIMDFNDHGRSNRTVHIYLGIGKTRQTALWFDGYSSWSSTKTVLELTQMEGDEDLWFRNVQHGGGIVQYHKKCQPTAACQGFIFIDFLGSSNMPEYSFSGVVETPTLWGNFAIEFYRNSDSVTMFEPNAKRQESRNYKAHNNSNGNTQWSADCIYASDNDMAFGYGLLMKGNGQTLGKITIGSEQKYIEQVTADAVANFWASSKRMFNLEVRSSSLGAVLPNDIVSCDSVNCRPLAIGHDWRDDKTHLTMIQR
jgi:hypothetical protein